MSENIAAASDNNVGAAGMHSA